MIAADIRTHLIDRLEPIFGAPKNADGLAGQLERYVPEHATGSSLEGLADRIIESRKAKGFPSASEMIALVKALPVPIAAVPGKRPWANPQDRMAAERAADEARHRALAMLRGSAIARRAVEERWAPALIEFVTKHGREPGHDEEQPLIAVSKRNDVDARDCPGPLGGSVRALRKTMLDRAARDLGLGAASDAQIVTGRVSPPPKPMDIKPVDPASLAPTDALLGRLAAKGV